MKRAEKIAQTIKDDKCFKITETDRYIYYTCKGISNHVYDIIYYKGLEKWKCNCNNIRTKSICYHIEICKQLRELEKTKNQEKS